MNRPTKLVALIAVWAIWAAVPAHADPTPEPQPGYQINGSFPGVQQYPPWCARNMWGCGFVWRPDTGTFQPRQ